MKAVIVRQPGGPEELEIVDVETPSPGPGQLLVRNFATSLNRADLLQRRGRYPPPPGESEILGLEFAGEVARVGAGARGFAVGDRVFGITGGGGYAEFLAVDARLAMSIPDTLSFDAAAAIPEAFLTASEALLVLGRLVEGERVLVHAGASGVGSAAIQIARHLGARVFATAGEPRKLELCRELGAERAIDRRNEDFAEVVSSEADGVDVVLDFVGASYFERNLAALADGGRLLVVGLLGGRRAELDLAALLFRRLSIQATAIRGRAIEDKAAMSARFQQRLLPLFATGELRPIIDSVHPIEDVRAAHERMEANQNAGKIVLRL